MRRWNGRGDVGVEAHLPDGAFEFLRERVGAIARAEMGWNDARWRSERERYRALIAHCYSLPADA